MGEASALLADLSIVTAGHNRYETFDQIFADIKIGIDKAQKEKAEPVSYLVIPKPQRGNPLCRHGGGFLPPGALSRRRTDLKTGHGGEPLRRDPRLETVSE